MTSYKFKAKAEIVTEMVKPIISSLEEIDTSFKIINQVNLALEELLVNIAHYAYAPGEGDVEISYKICNDELVVIIKDKGKEFNPIEAKDPDLDASVSERKIGGLGIYLVKNLVDDMKYQRVGTQNILEIHKKVK